MSIDHTDPFIKLDLLHLKTSKALRKWGWETFGNVFSNALSAKKEVRKVEAAVQNETATETDLLTVQTNLLNAIDIQDINKKFYHAYISYKRKYNAIRSIYSTEGRWINNIDLIALDDVKYYSSLLNSSVDLNTDYEDYFTKEVDYTIQLNLTEPPSDEEIWDALNTIDNSKTTGPNGFTADFYKKSWYIIKKEELVHDAPEWHMMLHIPDRWSMMHHNRHMKCHRMEMT
ncbi:uncharacterized protein LOC110039191 [Phalaenopsis equestris]|uniref:uncharacterized protein LOC110039191 n=1 Tax=Phalaenopsis equestris TaxID=78828 RepID=UPI0009E4485E|nr:uncharacterized protein LOC110039191 [Phalaenopsis equestris]